MPVSASSPCRGEAVPCGLCQAPGVHKALSKRVNVAAQSLMRRFKVYCLHPAARARLDHRRRVDGLGLGPLCRCQGNTSVQLTDHIAPADFRDASGPVFQTTLHAWFPAEAARWWHGVLRIALASRVTCFPVGASLCQFAGLITIAPAKCHAQRWNSCIVVKGTRLSPLPESVHEVLRTDLDTALAALRVRTTKQGKLQYFQIICHPTATPPAIPVAFAARSLSKGIAYHHFVNKAPGAEYPRLAAILLRNAVALYTLVGVAEIRLTTGLSVGGAIWPKLGFLPASRAEWVRLQSELGRRIDKLQGVARDLAERLVRPVCSDPDPRGIWAIASLEDREPGALRRIGETLLAGTRWRGVFSMENVDAWNLLDGYLGDVGLVTVTEMADRMQRAMVIRR
jgi:hypothetical protein